MLEPLPHVSMLLLFMANVLMLALYGLTISGHFPAEHRAEHLRTGAGPLLLWATIAATAAAAVITLLFAWRLIPWYAAVIGGGAMLLLVGVLSAYGATQRGLPGQVVDAAMVDGVALLASLVHGAIASGTWNERRAENLLDGGAPFYRTYPTADGREIAVGALEPQFFSELLRGLGLDEAELPAQYDRSGWPRLTEAIGEAVTSEPMDHWERLFASSDACVSPVRSWSEAPADPHLQSRGVMIEVEGLMQAAPAPRFSRTPLERPRAPSNTGSNTRQVLGELGYDEAAIGMLLRHRVATEE